MAEDLADFARVVTLREKPTWAHDPRELRFWPIARLLARRNELALYRALVKTGGGRQLGKTQLRGFKLLEPGAEVDRLTGLFANIHDPDYVARHIDFTNWFEWTQDLPGAFYLFSSRGGCNTSV